MNKYLYLLRDPATRDFDAFRQRVVQNEVPMLEMANPAGLKISLTTESPPKLTVLPLRQGGAALISVWHERDPTPNAWLRGQTPSGMAVSGYRVEDSTPRGYERDWPDGDESPGVVVLTLLKRNAALDQETFLQEWHGRHTPKALRIHPLWNYIRNVTREPVIDGSPAFEGVVEEHFRSRADALNPVRFFGGPLKFLPNMLEIFLHVRHFMDLKVSENYFLREIWLRTPE